MENQPVLSTEPTTMNRPHGCLTAALLVLIFGGVGVAGWVWLFAAFEPKVTPLLVGAGIYGFALLVIFGVIVLLLRAPRFGLWRGLALSLAVAGGYALVSGGYSAVDAAFRYFDLSLIIQQLLGIGYSVVILVFLRQKLSGKRSGALVWMGVTVGLLTGGVWTVFGVLGSLTETLLAVLEAVNLALAATAMTVVIFAYDEDFLKRYPFWAGLLAATALSGLLPGILATRGWWLQGASIVLTITPLSIAAGGLLAGEATEDQSLRGWWAVLALLFAGFYLPLAFTEGVEGYVMFDDFLGLWPMAGGIGLLIGGVFSLAVLAASKWLPRITPLTLPFAALSLVALIIVAVVYFVGGQPGLQPETFFVVMADQTDTSSAQDITDPLSRRYEVYEILTEHADDTQADLRAFLDQRARAYQPYYLVNGIRVETYNPFLRMRVSLRPDVARTLDNPLVRPLPAFGEPVDMDTGLGSAPRLSWGIDTVEADRVWDELGITGEGIIVGGADSGVDWRHPALQDSYLGSANDHDYTWFDPWEGTIEPTDTNGHGTHTIGTAVGNDGIGMAPDAQWIACRNLARNLGNPANYLDCMQFLFAPHPQQGNPLTDGDPGRGAHITNNSWGCPVFEGCDGQTLPVGVQHLRNAGQMMVVSAGNEGPQCRSVWSPAHADAALSVGANQQGGLVTSFSSRGPVPGEHRTKPDVVAPGYSIYSSIPEGLYASYPGTSMAGPHVAGLVALMWSADPDLIGDIDVTEAIIFDTADEQTGATISCGGDFDYNNDYGYGVIDALEAVQRVLAR